MSMASEVVWTSNSKTARVVANPVGQYLIAEEATGSNDAMGVPIWRIVEDRNSAATLIGYATFFYFRGALMPSSSQK